VIEHFVEEFVSLGRVGHNINDVESLFNKPICLDASVQFGCKNRSKIEVLAM
jgi:hypothetical protein